MMSTTSYKVFFIMEYNVATPIQLSRDQLSIVLGKLSRPKLFIPRNFGFEVTDGTYYKIDLRRVMAIQAIPIRDGTAG